VAQLRALGGLGLVALVAASTLAAAHLDSGLAADSRALCGSERWTVKTLQDRPTLLSARTATLHFLVTRPAPAELPYQRLPFERHIFHVTATVNPIRSEDDGDLHVILRDGRFHMIAEAPSTGCITGATLLRKRQMLQARQAVRLCRRASVTGVAFFDYLHGQTGVAPNGIELHPILHFRCLQG
jgi:hypothetical protein